MPCYAGQGGSSKKGYGIALKENKDWSAKLQALDVKWFYSWGEEIPEQIPVGIEFVPMVWGRWSCTQPIMKKLAAQKHKALLGFNEPERQEQANMTVEMALHLWPLLMETGMRLGSPAGVHPDGEWMTTFMKEADRRGYRVDFIAVHSYKGTNSTHFLNKLDQLYKRYKKPLWLTEFAVADWNAAADNPNKYSPAEVYNFMETVLPELEKRDYVERYAWYSSPHLLHPLSSSALFHADGSLTRLGKLYASF